jgi:NAD(P)H-quinone oxidoreductase subunit 5
MNFSCCASAVYEPAMHTLTTAPELLPRALGLAAAAIPVLFAAGALLAPARRPFGSAAAFAGAALLLSIVAPVTALVAGCSGPLPFGVRMDALTATLLLLVTVIGLVILRFSRSYLDGEGRRGATCAA